MLKCLPFKIINLSYVLFLLIFLNYSNKVLSQQNYAFDLSASRTSCLEFGGNDISTPWTVEFWVYKKGTTSYSSIIKSATYKINLETYGTAQKVGITEIGNYDASFPTGYTVPVGRWTHLAFSCNGVKTYLFVNGSLYDSLDKVIEMPMQSIGNASQSESPNAYVDELRFWSVARTAAEIQQYKNTEIDPYTDNLVAYFRGDDQSSPATDISMSGYTATLKNDAAYVLSDNSITMLPAPPKNYAFDLSANRNAAVVNSKDTSVTYPWTTEMWVYKKATTSYSSLLNGSNSKINLETYSGSQKVGITQKGSYDAVFPSGYVVPVGTWTHLAFTCNGTKTYLYVNGILNDSLSRVIPLPMTSIGNASQSESPNGYIDEVRLWNTVRTSDEIVRNMSREINAQSAHLIGYWKANDQAFPANDSSYLGRTGTMSNGATYVNTSYSYIQSSDVPFTIKSYFYTSPTQYLIVPGSTDQQLLRMVVNSYGAGNVASLTNVHISLDGTTNLDDIARIKLYTSGSLDSLSSGKLLGTIESPASNGLDFNLDHDFNLGKDNFWLVADIRADAAIKDKVKAAVTSFVLSNGTTLTPSAVLPYGSRTIDSAQILVSPTSVISIIPKPQVMTVDSGFYRLNASTSIEVSNDSIMSEGTFLADLLKPATGFPFSTSVGGTSTSNTISLSITSNMSLGLEGYKFKVENNKISIQANTRMGLFWGIQTLRQLLPSKIESKYVQSDTIWNVPLVDITDYPTYKYRGSMLDVCRHIFSPDMVKRYIEMLSLYKINVFHWHLTEDQGFRIESKKYPELNQISSWRNCPGSSAMVSGEAVPYGGYFTQDEIKDIVAYATARHITVIPEFEFPGHSVEILAAHPELGCTSGTPPYSVRCAAGVSDDMFCAGKDTTFNFIFNLLDEIIPLFPSPYFHIGGDETPFTKWKTCTDCLNRMTSLGLTGGGTDDNAEALKKYFMERIIAHLASKGKKAIGWTEVFTHGLRDSSFTVQDWLGSAASGAASYGNDVIMSQYYYLYLDAVQSSSSSEPASIGYSPNTLEKVYNYNIMPSGLTSAQQAHIIGAEAPLWTEMIVTDSHLEYMLSPRIQALAENTWSSAGNKDVDDFKQRLYTHFARWDTMNYNYRPLDISNTDTVSIAVDSCSPVVLTAPTNADSYYWTDSANTKSQSISVTQSGMYIVYYYNLGRLLSKIYNVQVQSTPAPVILKNDDVLTSSVTDGISYQWYLNGQSIDNATGISYTPTEEGTYSVNVTGSNGCMGKSTDFVYSSTTPVTIVSFTAKKAGTGVNLIWKTQQEANNSGFDIERSIDGKSFEKIGFVEGAGNAQIMHAYFFNDVKPNNGNNYYRLKQVNYDNSFEYSEVRQINFSSSDKTVVYPNPAKNIVHFDIKSNGGLLQIFDASGKLVFHKNMTSQNVFTLNVKNYAAGTYYWRLGKASGSFIKN